MSKVSIIVPVYKVEAFIHRCVDSILGQTCQDFELILVDDGSPDNCGKICDGYAAQDPRVHVIHQKNAGCSAARNAGIEYTLKNSKSRWIVFVDSDDWLHRDNLKFLLKAVEETGAGMAVCDCIWTAGFCKDEELVQSEFCVLDSEEAFVQHYPECMPPWGKIIDKSLLTELRFPVGVRYEDACISHILTFSAEKVAVCPEKLYYYYNNENSFTRTGWTEGRLQVVRVHKDRLDYLRAHGYEQAYRRELEEYVERITSNLLSLTDLLDKDKKYTVIFEDLRATLRGAVREAEELGVFHFDRERMMSYAYVSPGNAVWRMARGLQRIWRKVLRR